MQILLAILSFCVIIIIHELGHFVSAKLCGIQVNEFALGMGPVIFRAQKGETAYVIRLLPIGGSVSMEGEDGDSDTENPRAFNHRPIWQRMIVLLAGVFMNFVLGFAVIAVSICISENPIASRTISVFREQSISDSQLMVGDELISVDGMHVFIASDFAYKLQNSTDRNEKGNLIFDVTVRRNGEVITLRDVEFTSNRTENGSTVYLDFYVLPVEKNFITVVSESARESLSTGRLIIMTLLDLIRGKYGISDLSGPVGVVSVVSQSVSYGWTAFLRLVSMITINVGVMNLLPIPALDGCRFLFLVIEAIRRKPMKPEHEGMVHFAGFALLMILMLVVTFNDITRLFTGG